MSGPRVHSISPLSSPAEHVVAVENNEIQAKPVFEFVFPLENYGWWTRDHRRPHFLPHDQFAQDQSGFDCFSESNVIRDEQVGPRKLESLPQRLKLISLHLNPGAVRGLEQSWICRSN